MFLNRISKIFISSTRPLTTSNIFSFPRGSNPGLNRYLKEMDDANEKISNDPEGFGDFESDFMNVHKTHRQYTEEMEAFKEFVRLKIVKNKYFKSKYPNFLTFAEKEQIRLLNSREPEEWTPDKLSESFPADRETILKILKARWYPRNEKRLYKHDEKVIENWEKFRKGEFSQLPDDLIGHLEKFAARKFSDLKNIAPKWLPKRPTLPKPKTNEFSSIITSCKAYKENKLIENNEKKQILVDKKQENEIIVNKFVPLKSDEKETFLTGEIINKTPITLDALKTKAGLISSEDKNSLLQVEKNTFAVDANSNDNNKNSESSLIQKFNFSEITISESDMKKYNATPIKQRIHIPRKLWKRDATYKVEDCYYDFDGEFLFKVPGMTGKINTENS